jgi:hypothetical protein
MSRKNYNVVLNSTFCTSDTSTNVVADKNYYIDWSATLPDKNFKLTFTFMSETNTITQMATLPIITIDFLNQGNIDICQPTYQATSSNILGLIYPTILDTTTDLAYFRAEKNFNNSIYLSRPRQNNFNVQIKTNGSPSVLWTDEAATPLSMAQYVLILSFEECE